jgi:hypothetical protein
MERENDSYNCCTITITFGDVAENHVGMQKLGEKAKDGFTINEMKKFERIFKKEQFKVEYYDLSAEIEFECEFASVLVVKNGLSLFVEDTNLFYETEKNRDWDTKAIFRGQVKNKLARYNLCYADFSQEPDYEAGKGRVIDFKESEDLQSIRAGLGIYLGKKGKELNAEGNKYYDVKKCGIGFHGDLERKIVVAFRLGDTMPLCYAWFLRNEPISAPVTINIEHGDMYIMSEKAVGTDWKKSSIPTLRHAAGCEKYIGMKVFEKRVAKRKEDKEYRENNREKNESKLGLTKKIKAENKKFEDLHPTKTMKELKELAKSNKISGYTQMDKGELIGILIAYGLL